MCNGAEISFRLMLKIKCPQVAGRNFDEENYCQMGMGGSENLGKAKGLYHM